MKRKDDSGTAPPEETLRTGELPPQRLGDSIVPYRSEPPAGPSDREIHPRREVEPLPEGPPVPDPHPSPPAVIESPQPRRTPG